MRTICLLLCVIFGQSAIQAQTSIPEIQPPEEAVSKTTASFNLTAACFADNIEKREWILVLNGWAYRDLKSLKAGLTKMPKGSTITWSASDTKIGGEPLSTKEELVELQEACKSNGLSLRIIPAG